MNSKLRALLAIILCFCTLRNNGCSRSVWTMASGKEDLELEREVQSLYKPPVKTIQLGGEVVDCIGIYSQPALDNPILKNHKIQLRPTSFPAEIKSSAPLTDPISETWSKMEACPDGTVPIHRTAKHDLERSISLSHQMSRNISNANPLAPKTKQVFVKINYRDQVTYYGVSGSSSVYKVLLPSTDMSSAANAWVEGNNNVLMAGWMVSQSITGDDNPRLFVYWTADNGEKTGCFNLDCQGFVQTDRRISPKSALEPVSKFGGATYDVKVTIYQDPVSGNWWLMVLNNYTIGYWPKEIVPGLQNGGGAVGWGGIAMGNEKENSPPMGSGQFPDGFYDHGAYFRDIRYMVTKSLDQVTPSQTDPVLEHVDGQGCYKLQNDKFTGLVIWGYRFSFGGPGGPCAK